MEETSGLILRQPSSNLPLNSAQCSMKVPGTSVSMRVTGAGVGLERGLLYVLYLCNQRDMLMLFFSFSVSQGSETGLEGEEDGRRCSWPHLGP